MADRSPFPPVRPEREPRILLRLAITLGWGVVWGVALGAWAIYPHLLRTHHVHPANPEQWVLLAGLAVGLFGSMGAMGAFLVWVAIESALFVRRASLRSAGWALGIAVLVALPPLYFLVAAFAETMVSRSLPGLESYRSFLPLAVGSYFVLAGLLLVGYRRLVRTAFPPRASVLAIGAAAAAAAGLAMTPIWGETIRFRDVEVPRLVRIDDARPTAPLLFVGVDSGSWRVAKPMMDRGDVPTLRGLVASGFSGEVLASWRPVLSGPAWASIVTGHPRQHTGVYQEIAAIIPGLPPFQIPLELDFLLDPIFLIEYKLAAADYIRLAPLPRNVLRRPPFWERLAQYGLRVAVVRAPFTFPADGQAEIVISDYVGEDAWKFLEVRARAESRLASPPRLAAGLVSTFDGPSPTAERLVARLLAGAQPPETDSPAPIGESLRVAAEIDLRTIEVAERLVRSRPDLSVVVVYLGGFDTVCHAFWQYRFPGDFRDEPRDEIAIRELGPVIDRYLEFLDRGIGRLIDAFPEPPTVVLTADHGHGPLYGNRIYTGGHSVRDGFFVAAGPGVSRQADMREVRYFDVVPTIFELLGFAQPEDLEGRSLLSLAEVSPPGSEPDAAFGTERR